MAEIRLTTAFGSVPADAQDAIRDILVRCLEAVAQEEGSFRKARAVFTESDERCVFTVELDGVRKDPNPLVLDLERIEDAVTDPTAQGRLKEDLRAFCRRVLGR